MKHRATTSQVSFERALSTPSEHIYCYKSSFSWSSFQPNTDVQRNKFPYQKQSNWNVKLPQKTSSVSGKTHGKCSAVVFVFTYSKFTENCFGLIHFQKDYHLHSLVLTSEMFAHFCHHHEVLHFKYDRLVRNCRSLISEPEIESCLESFHATFYYIWKR